MDRRVDRSKTTAATLLPPAAVVAGAAHSGLRGWRLSMEDAVVTQLFGRELGLFAVLDGHGGSYCSTWAANQLPYRLQHIGPLVEAAPDADEAWQVRTHVYTLDEAIRRIITAAPTPPTTASPPAFAPYVSCA
jgi:serine/threonine protein phosphatase PrpC